jgi:hypothetical protein
MYIIIRPLLSRILKLQVGHVSTSWRNEEIPIRPSKPNVLEPTDVCTVHACKCGSQRSGVRNLFDKSFKMSKGNILA